jgi:CDP-diacylglycerol---glycerol-3-phosphate 3-phosphatidyltransferase
MLTIPNAISLLRIPLALLFLQENPAIRAFAIIFAMLTDAIDGFLARRYKLISRSGTLIDPLMDKFFVFFALATLMTEEKLSVWNALAFICRDFSIILFGIYLALSKKLASYQFRAIWCGKVTTTMQFVVLLLLALDYTVPSYVFASFIILGFLALIELATSKFAPLDVKENG